MSTKFAIRLTLKKNSDGIPPFLTYDVYAFGLQSHDLFWAGDPLKNKRSAWSELMSIANAQGMTFRKVTDNSSAILHAWKNSLAEIEFGILQVGEISGNTFTAKAHVIFEDLSIDRMEMQNVGAYSLDTVGILSDRASYSLGNVDPKAVYQQMQLIKRRDALMRERAKQGVR